MLRIAVACVFFALPVVAQPSSNDLRRSPEKRFPPEIPAARRDSSSLKLTRAYCVDTSFERRSVQFRRCPKGAYIRLVPSIHSIVPQ